MTKLWERYFLRETAKIFFLVIFGFYFLYILIDYSSHARAFEAAGITLWDTLSFYGCVFVQRVDLIVPFGLLLASMRTLCALNLNNELVAMRASGVPLKRLTRPFLILGLLFTGALYLNQEFILPSSQVKYRFLEDKYLRYGQRNKRLQAQAFSDLQLRDGSTLLYQSYDSSKKRFFDVFWIRDLDNLYRIKHMTLEEQGPRGEFVDHLTRNDAGEIELSETYQSQWLPRLHFDDETLSQVLTGPADQSLAKLWAQIPQGMKVYTDHDATVLTYFHYRLAMPWLCFLVILAPAPYCVRFSRTLRVFFIYALGILALICFYLVMDTSVILGQHQVLPPVWSVWGPMGAFLLLSGIRYAQME